MTFRLWVILFLFGVIFLGGPRVVAAAEESAASAAAQALFDEGRKLMKEGKFEEACPKLAESQRLEPAVGTQFNLANCYEKLGRTASAWTMYLEVAAQARTAERRARERLARERATALEAQLSRLNIVVPAEARIEGLRIVRDGIEVGEGQWDVPVPVDPGKHSLSVSADGYETWTNEIVIAESASTQTITVPALEKLSDQPKAAASTGGLLTPDDPQADRDSASGFSTQQYIGMGVAGLGLVGLGIGGYFALDAMSKHDDSGCDATCPDASAKSLNDDARTSGNVATVAGIVGLVGVAAGATLFFVDFDGEQEGTLQVGGIAGPGNAGIRVRGAW